MIELTLILISMTLGCIGGALIMRRHYKKRIADLESKDRDLNKKISELESENKDLIIARDMWSGLYHQDAVQILGRN